MDKNTIQIYIIILIGVIDLILSGCILLRKYWKKKHYTLKVVADIDEIREQRNDDHDLVIKLFYSYTVDEKKYYGKTGWLNSYTGGASKIITILVNPQHPERSYMPGLQSVISTFVFILFFGAGIFLIFGGVKLGHIFL